MRLEYRGLRSHLRLPSMLLAVFATVLWVASLAAGCGARDDSLFGKGSVGGSGGTTTNTGGTGGSTPLPPASTERVDVLMVLDNSRSMADKQAILGLAVPDLIAALINPACLDEKGVPAPTPATPDDPCPPGSKRQFPAQQDIHIGVITTSLGGHGADVCDDAAANDNGHLIWRTDTGGQVPTYDELGFLAWDPKAKSSPPGQNNPDALVGDLTTMVLGAGQIGCGYEAPHEAWYRFLVEPDPYQNIEIENNVASLVGTDDVVLQQRADFLRPDSLLMIMVLSDENDCSIRDGGQYYFAAQVYTPGTSSPYHLPKARAICASDPNSPCCRSCGQQAGEGCDDSKDDCAGPLEPLDDQINLRCWDQKRRFGIDFLQPIERYADGLREKQVADRHGTIMPNPLFSDLDPNDNNNTIRDHRLVFLASLIGVPWQDIARLDGNGEPDLIKGKDAKGNPVGAFQSASELKANKTWDLVLGDPSKYHTDPGALPNDPLMVETFEPRAGTHPITGEQLAAPGATYDANSINGHEYSIPNHNDLQYACVFALPQPRDCSDPKEMACDCDGLSDNPLCQDPENNKFGKIQFRAKAYPGIRHLQIAKAIDEQGVIGSICPAQLHEPGALDFGYRPTVRTLIGSVAPVLQKK